MLIFYKEYNKITEMEADISNGISTQRILGRIKKPVRGDNSILEPIRKPNIEESPDIIVQPIEKPRFRLPRKPISGEKIITEPIQSNVLSLIQEDPCTQLYDPCTREPIDSLQELEQRIKDIKKIKTAEIVFNTFPSSVITRLQLLEWILNLTDKPNDNLLQYTINGQLYESYWDIVFALGLSQFPITNDFYMYQGKVENLVSIDSEQFINHPIQYLQTKNINESSKSGASDITFIYKENKQVINTDACSYDSSSLEKKPQLYFCSSKYYKQDHVKGIDKFDIQNIYTAAKSLDPTKYDRKIILLVRDKHAVEQKIRNAMRKYISEEASFVFGTSDLYAALTRLYDHPLFSAIRKDGKQITEEHIRVAYNITTQPKSLLKLHLHQYMATYKIANAIKNFKQTNNANNKFLVGIVPRGGKTFIAGGIVNELQPTRVVMILGAMSETLSQFMEIFKDKYQNFQDYECIDVVKQDRTFMITDPSKKYIFMMSIELYKTEQTIRKLLQQLKTQEMRADLFICDEAHLKQITVKATTAVSQATKTIQNIEEESEEASDDQEESQLIDLDRQILSDVPVVYMTGTYMKPLTALRIPYEHVILWDYEDIQHAKELQLNETTFKQTYGEDYTNALETCMRYGETYETIQNQYRKFPELYLFTTQFTPDAKDAFLKQTSSGFPTLSHLFEVRRDFDPFNMSPEQWYTGFTQPHTMMRLINYISPPTHAISEIDGSTIEPITSVLKSIDQIAQRIGDRLRFFTTDFVIHSQLWFLPHMQQHPLVKRICALVGSIFKNKWFRKNFVVVAVSSSIKWSIHGSKDNKIDIPYSDGTTGTFSWACPKTNQSLKDCLIEQEKKAQKNGKGVIFLAQNMLHLGISLPCVDIVTLFDVGEKIDERIQKMFRALTESTEKKGGYIIDMNYFRTVTALIEYQITANKAKKKQSVYKESLIQSFNQILDTYSIDIDRPIFGTHEERTNGSALIQKTTIPELEKMVKILAKKGDGVELLSVAYVLDSTVTELLKNDYDGLMGHYFEAMKEEKKNTVIRESNQTIPVASHYPSEPSESSGNNSKTNANHDPFGTKLTDAQRKDAYVEMFKTTLKLGVFGTEMKSLALLKDKLLNDAEFREIVYDTLYKRGIIVDYSIYNDTYQHFVIDHLIIPGLDKIISQGRNQPYTNMKDIINDENQYPVHIQKVLTYIKDNLSPNDVERHKYGEVFTPMTLVDEMLDTLPDSVWSDKTLTWLDPANGMGNYPIAVFLRLFYGFRTKDGKYVGITNTGEGKFHPGLTRVIPTESARRSHIVKNMLFMVELNNKNIIISRRLFEKLAPGVQPNIIQHHRSDGFLHGGDMNFQNKTMKTFDIIMGNPPYNPPKTESNGGYLWPQFVIKSHTLLNDKGYLLFVHPPGWKKPTNVAFKAERFSDGDYTKPIDQSFVWPILKDTGAFIFICTFDQRSRTVENNFIPHFPSIDYYLYQKGGNQTVCRTKNVFLGSVYKSDDTKLNYNLSFLPNFITKESQDIIHKVTSKNGDKPTFSRGIDEREKQWSGKSIKWLYAANKNGFTDKTHGIHVTTLKGGIVKDTVNINKVVINFGGGIDAYHVSFIPKSDEVGVLDMTMYSEVDSIKEGKSLGRFFSSDIVRFIFLITQYVAQPNTKNEHLVANSITIPTDGITDYYAFFGIEGHKKYIEDMLEHYMSFKAPKRTVKTSKAKGGRILSNRATRKIRRHRAE